MTAQSKIKKKEVHLWTKNQEQKPGEMKNPETTGEARLVMHGGVWRAQSS